MIQENAKQADIATRVGTALYEIEKENPKLEGIVARRYADFDSAAISSSTNGNETVLWIERAVDNRAPARTYQAPLSDQSARNRAEQAGVPSLPVLLIKAESGRARHCIEQPACVFVLRIFE